MCLARLGMSMHSRVRFFLVSFVCLVLGTNGLPQTNTTAAPQSTVPEVLTYGIEWRLFRAGVSKLSWVPSAHGKQTYDVDLHLESAGTLARLYKVDNLYKAHLEDNLCATNFSLVSHEGKRVRDTQVAIDRSRHKATYVERDLAANNKVLHNQQTDVPACVPDVIGALARMRLLTIGPGQSTQIPVTDGKKWTNAKVEAQEREEVKTPAGTFKTLRYEAFLFDGALFARKARLFVWITDDARRLPVQLRMKFAFPVGIVTLQLEKEEKS